MSIQFFTPRGPQNELLKLPSTYRRTVRWLPRIGDIFPDFSVETTQGPLSLWDWAGGSWVHLFSHPAAFTPVCTTELASFASLAQDWKEADIKLLGLTGSSVETQLRWHAEIEELFGVAVDFPNGHDRGMNLARLFGMIHEHESLDWPIRKSFLLDPVMRVQMIFEYPIYIGRNSEEILRVARALQLRAETGAATPADWDQGDMAIVPDTMNASEARRIFGAEPRRLTPYLTVIGGTPDTSRDQPRACG